MQTKYRSAVLEDRPQLIALRQELWPDCAIDRHESEANEVLKGEGLIAVAESSGMLVGFAEVSIRADYVEGTASTRVPYLEGWYVRSGHRGKGIGRELIGFVERWAISRRFHEIASDAEIENSRSIRLHTQLGFSEVGRTVHFVKTIDRKNA